MASGKRKLTAEDVFQYEPMMEMFLRDHCLKNWSDSRKNGAKAFLGTSGFSIEDLRQHLRTEVCVALQEYNPAYRTPDGKSVKESTFVYRHLWFRVGQLMKRNTKQRMGYGIVHKPIQSIFRDGTNEESYLDLDLVSAMDARAELENKDKSQVQQYLERAWKQKARH